MGPFLAKLIERTKAMKIGDPNNEDTTVGATISEAQFNKVMNYVNIAKKEVSTTLKSIIKMSKFSSHTI